MLTPMKKIEKSRAKWRTKEEDLEESWGSLSFFNKSHRGRVSIDMGGEGSVPFSFFVVVVFFLLF